jgi:hypothetical protein
MPEQSLDTIRISRGTAQATGAALAALVEERLPLMVQTKKPTEPMRLIGPAMLARGAGTVQAIGKLAPLNREADAGVLLRLLLEHMITFAWLAADKGNKRFALWLKGDSKQRLKMHNDLPSELDELLPAPLKALFGGIVGVVDGELPHLRARAQYADADWGPRLRGVLQPSIEWASFLGLYRIVYRYLSGFTHAGLLSLSPVIKRGKVGGDIVAMETHDGERSAVALAPLAPSTVWAILKDAGSTRLRAARGRAGLRFYAPTP